MKKFIVLSAIGLLVLLYGAPLYAQKADAPKVDFKVSGFIFAASFLGVNTPHAYDIPTWQPIVGWMPPLYGPTPLFDPATGRAFDKTRSFMQSRGILKLDASVGKELSGTVIFEMDSGQWGERGEGRNNIGRWNADQAAVEIKNLYVDIAIPPIVPVPMTARVGLQGYALRPKVIGYWDGMGITGGIKIDPITIQPIWFKALERLDFASDDIDIYGLNILGKFGEVTAGAYGIYQDAKTYPLPATGPSSPTRTNKSNLWWLGVYTDGKFGPVNANFDLVMDTGKVESKADPTLKDVKYRGWAGRLKIDYPWEKFNFGVIGMYATGSDAKKTDGGTPNAAGGLPGGTTPFGTPNRRVSGFVAPIASEQFPFGDSLLISGDPIWNGFMGYSVLNYTGVSRGAIGGTWIAKLYGSYKVKPWYKVTLAGIYIGDTTKNANTMGSARKIGTSLPRDDKTIGFEVDFINEINLYRNLKWDIGLGYLFAGKALDHFNTLTGTNKSGKDPWALVTRLTFTF